MYSKLFVVVAFAASTVSGLVLGSRDRAHYDGQDNEDYDTYHARYKALHCHHRDLYSSDQTKVDFFNSCCHPLLKGQSLDSRPAECNPWAPSSGDGSDDGDCDDGSSGSGGSDGGSGSGGSGGSGGDSGSGGSSDPSGTTGGSDPSGATGGSSGGSSGGSGGGSSGGSSGGSGGQEVDGGHATWFTQNNNAGACGIVHQDSDFIVAMDSRMYGNGEFCGKTVFITNTATGATATATIQDECPTCDNAQSLDMSEALFQALAGGSLDEGEFDINYVLYA